MNISSKSRNIFVKKQPHLSGHPQQQREGSRRQGHQAASPLHGGTKSSPTLQTCLFVLTGSSQGSQLFTLIAGMQMSSSEFVCPDALLDLGFCSPRLDASLQLGAPVSWEMSLGDEHRNRTLPLQLGHFSWHVKIERIKRSSATPSARAATATTPAEWTTTASASSTRSGRSTEGPASGTAGGRWQSGGGEGGLQQNVELFFNLRPKIGAELYFYTGS